MDAGNPDLSNFNAPPSSVSTEDIMAQTWKVSTEAVGFIAPLK